MRYAYLLAVLIGSALATESALAQQGDLLPVMYDGYSVQNTVAVPSATVVTPQQNPYGVTACSYVPKNCAATDACPTLLGESCCEDSCPGRVFGGMEYLYWQATRDATPFAGTLSRPSGTIHGLPIDSGVSLVSTLRDADYGRNSGFRANIGYRMTDRCDIGFRYTYFYTNGASMLGDPNVDADLVLANRLDRNLANSILDQSFDDGEADFASQRIRLNLNIYDIEIRRRLRLNSQRFGAHFMGGFRFAEIDQASQIIYQNLESGILLRADTDETMDMCAAGLMFGGDVEYQMGWHTSIFARGAVSLLYANFDVSRLDVQTSATEAGVRSISDSFQSFVPVLELNVGVRWQRGRFHAAAGYNVAHWFDMVQGLDAINQDDVDGATNSYRVERSGLSFDGFFAEAGLRF